MTLGFKEYYPFDKTRKTDFQDKIAKGAKVHTFRQDKNNRYKAGVQLHMATGVRTADYFCFDDTKFCVSTQQVLMVYYPKKNNLEIRVNRRKLKPQEVHMLISYDGFDNRKDFISWFFPDDNTMWGGKIIHWTNLKY